MAEWIPVGDGFIAADVIRWKEPVFKNRRRGRAACVGERLVTAEVLHKAGLDGWAYLLVRGSEVVSARIGWSVSDVLLPATGKETKRQLRTIVRGNPERLAWSDESARSIVASRFRGPDDPAVPASENGRKEFAMRPSRNAILRVKKKRPGKAGRESPSLRY